MNQDDNIYIMDFPRQVMMVYVLGIKTRTKVITNPTQEESQKNADTDDACKMQQKKKKKANNIFTAGIGWGTISLKYSFYSHFQHSLFKILISLLFFPMCQNAESSSTWDTRKYHKTFVKQHLIFIKYNKSFVLN